MWSWIDATATLVAHYPNWALAVAFTAAIIEAIAVVGMVVPGTFILMAVAGAAAMGGQSMIPFLVVAIIGAVIGDFLSFWAGHRYRHRLSETWPFATRPHILDRANRFFRRYGTASVAFCRFVPVLRSTVPLAAGVAGMRRQRFVLANVASALVWAPVHVYPAQFAGLSVGGLIEGEWKTAALWAAALLACGALAWLLHRHMAARAGSGL